MQYALPALLGLLVGFLLPLPLRRCKDRDCGICRWVFLFDPRPTPAPQPADTEDTCG